MKQFEIDGRPSTWADGFTRDATQARTSGQVQAAEGRRSVVSVLQDFADDPMGKLMEGLFECIDQYESELNGLRTSAAMREAVRQGFWPGARAPEGLRLLPLPKNCAPHSSR